MMKITILTENNVRQRDLLAEHGLSFWIEDGVDKVLFDVGQTDIYLHNARQLGVDVTQAQAIVLSHGHFDHTGGLSSFPAAAGWPRVFIHPDAFIPKFEKTADAISPYQAIGIPWSKERLGALDKQLMFNTSTRQVGESLYAITGIPQTTDYEKPAAQLMVRKNGAIMIDDLHDEQLLVCRQDHGLVVALGCSHPGVVNCLMHIRQLFPEQPIRCVIGGMHLEKADDNRLRQTFAYFRQQDIAEIIPLHCTGQNVIWQMKRELGDRVRICSTGDVINFQI